MNEYFSHDYKARSDSKLVNLQMKHGMAGIGVYWCLVEMIYENGGFIPESDCERIAFELRTEYERIKNVLQDFGLFYLNDKIYRSESVDKRLSIREEKSEKTRQSINARWERVRNERINTNVIQSNENRNTIKEKNSIVNISNTWRSDFKNYLTECKDAYRTFIGNEKLMAEQARLNPGINVPLSIEKGFTNFWGTEAGWKHKKKSRSVEIDWRSTIVNSISMNKVYFTKQELANQ